MIGVKKCVIFLLVVTLTDIFNSVHGRSIDQPVLLYVVPEAVNDQTIVPSDGLVESEKVAPVIVPVADSVPVPIPSEKNRIQVFNVMLDALKSVNENALELIRTYVSKLDDRNRPASDLESGVVVLVKETPEPILEPEQISGRDLTPEDTTAKTLPQIKVPQIQIPVIQLPQLQVPHITFVPVNSQTVLNPIHSALAKYKAAINHLVKKFKAVPNHIIKKFKGTGLADEVQSDETQQADTVAKPEEEKPADETVTVQPAEETISEKPEDVKETEEARLNIVARKLDSSNGEILAESETAIDANTPEEIADRVKTILEATRKLNDLSFELIQGYLNQITDLSSKDQSPKDEVVLDARAAASEVQEITIPIVPGCEVGYVLIDGECREVYTAPVVPTNPLIAPINVLVKFVGSIIEPIVPKNVAEDIATQVKLRAEAIVRDFATN